MTDKDRARVAVIELKKAVANLELCFGEVDADFVIVAVEQIDNARAALLPLADRLRTAAKKDMEA